MDGKLQGIQSSWYQSKPNQLFQQSVYVNNKQEGFQKSWDKNGILTREHFYINGCMDGEQLAWYPTGEKMYKFLYKKDNKHGIQTRWYKDGHIEYIECYNNGKIDGPPGTNGVAESKASKVQEQFLWCYVNGQLIYIHHSDGILV